MRGSGIKHSTVPHHLHFPKNKKLNRAFLRSSPMLATHLMVQHRGLILIAQTVVLKPLQDMPYQPRECL
jgi:hypothetical protein